MSTDHVRNVSGILSHAKAKSETVKQRIDLAIESLMRENLAVNFNSVAARACVSKTTLYNHPEYRTRIESLRQLLLPENVCMKERFMLCSVHY